MKCVLLLLGLCSCGASYEAYTPWSGGYGTTRVSPGRYVISAHTSSFWNRFDDAVRFVYWRAQEICEKDGFKTFDVDSDRRPGSDAFLVVTCTNARRSVSGEQP